MYSLNLAEPTIVPTTMADLQAVSFSEKLDQLKSQFQKSLME